MNNNLKGLRLLSSLLALFSFGKMFAQESTGGVPLSFTEDSIYLSPLSSVQLITMGQVNIDSLLASDAYEKQNGEIATRFGYAIDVNYSLTNSGKWDTLPNGNKVWRLRINSPNAFSINLIYDKFILSGGSKLYIYNNDKSIILGAFTALNNQIHQEFSTDLVKGDAIILEYFEPAEIFNGVISIKKVVHAYLDITSGGEGLSGSCNIDVNCPEGDPWCIEKRAVSMILVDNNTRICSGCLINNVTGNLIPYYLTARHCLQGSENTWLFRFHYKRTVCNGQTIDLTRTISGSTTLSSLQLTDFALLQLSSAPYSGFGIVYAGWDRSSTAPLSTTGLHHPSGDVMKIHFDFSPAIPNPNTINWNNNTNSPSDTHWETRIDLGTMEPISSGSPAFNQNHRIVGQLHGGQPGCVGPNNLAYYGMFNLSWQGLGTPQTRLRDWLDPFNTNTVSIGPTSPKIYLINRTETGNQSFAAVNEMQLEGELNTSGEFCQPTGVIFTTEPSSNINYRARTIIVKKETHFKLGSEVSLIAVNNIQCSDNLVDGDFVQGYCTTNYSQKTNNNSDTPPKIENNLNSISENTLSPEIKLAKNLHKYEFTLMPNPTTGEFIIILGDDVNFPSSIIIEDILGRCILSIPNPDSNSYSLSLRDVSKGMYLIKVIFSERTITKRLIKN